MTRRRDELVGRVGFGSGTMIAEGYGAVDEDAARGAVEAAFAGGVRFYDTAHFYGSGRSEAIVGEVLESRRDQVSLCTKGGVRYRDPRDLLSLECDASYPALRRFMEDSLTRLRTDHVDVYLLHQFDPALTPEEQMANLQRLKDEGLTREVGFCNFGAEASRRALATGIPTAVEYSFSLLDQRYLDELDDAGRRGGLRITYGSYVHGLLSEGFREDHEFDPDDWRGRSRREGQSGTSGNVFFAGPAFAANLGVARQLRTLADSLGVSLAAFVLAVTIRRPHSDVALFGCRNEAEVQDGLRGLEVPMEGDVLEQVEEIVSAVERPSRNMIGRP